MRLALQGQEEHGKHIGFRLSIEAGALWQEHFFFTRRPAQCYRDTNSATVDKLDSRNTLRSQGSRLSRYQQPKTAVHG